MAKKTNCLSVAERLWMKIGKTVSTTCSRSAAGRTDMMPRRTSHATDVDSILKAANE